MGKFRMGLNVVHPAGALHWSSLRSNYRTRLRPTVTSVDYLSALPGWLGMMGNDTIGDCLDCALYHSDQGRTQYATGTCITQPDTMAPELYSKITGWDGTPGSASDQGSDPSQSFGWVERNGLPRSDGSIVQLLASIEIDPRNTVDVMEAMEGCVGLHVGISVPSSLERDMGANIWDYVPGDEQIMGGHEIWVGKKLSPITNYGLVSWGSRNYEMTPAFWERYVNQCTALIFDDEVAAAGKLPFGMTRDELIAEMNYMRSGATS